MKNILIVESNTLVAEDIAEIVLGRWAKSCPAVVTTAAQAVSVIRGGATFQAAVLRFSQTDAQRAQLLALLIAAGTKLVVVDDAAAPSLRDSTQIEMLPDAQYIAQPFTTNEMLQTLERALIRDDTHPKNA